MAKIITFLKNWTLPVSMISGALAYYICRQLPLSYEVKFDILTVIEVLQPVLLFLMLFVAFCKIKPTDLKPHRWHLWLLLTQCLLFAAACAALWLYPSTGLRVIIEGFMLAIICPTATACAVVTQKLGGDSAATTSYTIIINMVVALLCPLLLPVAHPQEGLTFFPAFMVIIHKVFPLLIVPLFLAWFVRYLMPSFHKRIVATKDLAFYMWAVSLAIAIAVTCKALAHSHESMWNVGGIAVVTLVACLFQFSFGKWIGSHYGKKMEAGQALGQKNTVFIIWLGYTFLSPITAAAGGFYSVWHNLVNSWQLYKKRKE
ncbi:MAG: transporter [Prevotella sp.]|nr:transporter [Prevotella sp.]MCI7581077.1 transporter [Prevotella sp.]MDD7029778.1 transporter [Prevotellaceae bacterium]MDY3253468.1 transporter [Prevotella sp.]MDY5209167.1 transporter [Prevotella sp.]